MKMMMSPNPVFSNSALSNEQSRQDLWNLSVDSSYACAFLGREKIIRGVCWKVKEESASIVIKAEMNDGFRGCGVDRLDDRGAKGPSNFKSVLGRETVIAMPAHPSSHTMLPQTYVYKANLWAYMNYMGVNG